jgi:hypothetical protein
MQVFLEDFPRNALQYYFLSHFTYVRASILAQEMIIRIKTVEAAKVHPSICALQGDTSPVRHSDIE